MARYNRCEVCGEPHDVSTARLFFLCEPCRSSFERSCEPDLRSILKWAGKRARRTERARHGFGDVTPVEVK